METLLEQTRKKSFGIQLFKNKLIKLYDDSTLNGIFRFCVIHSN